MRRTALYVSLTGIMAALFLCAPLSASAFKGAGSEYGPGCREPGILGCIETLDLTEKQRVDIDALRTEARAAKTIRTCPACRHGKNQGLASETSTKCPRGSA